MHKHKKIASRVIVILFLVALLLPNIVHVLNLEKNLVSSKNRTHKLMPNFNLLQPITFLGQFKNYYLENFGLKASLVNSYIDFKYNILHENPIPNRVVSGRDNWLFLGNHSNEVLNNSFGNAPFTKKELENTVNYLKAVSRYFSSKNIPFYVAIASDKNRIYQEYLPYKLKQNSTKLQTLKNTLKKEINLPIIDLSTQLLKGKTNQQLYYKNDTHWNYYGAYIGYSHIIDEINKQFPIEKAKLNDFNIYSNNAKTLDLAQMINLKTNETTLSINKKTKSNAKVISQSIKSAHYKNPSKKLKLMLFRDSFTIAMTPFFNETFNEVKYLYKYTFTKEEIETYKPDVVIFEIIERNIDAFGKLPPFNN